MQIHSMTQDATLEVLLPHKLPHADSRDSPAKGTQQVWHPEFIHTQDNCTGAQAILIAYYKLENLIQTKKKSSCSCLLFSFFVSPANAKEISQGKTTSVFWDLAENSGT